MVSNICMYNFHSFKPIRDELFKFDGKCFQLAISTESHIQKATHLKIGVFVSAVFGTDTHTLTIYIIRAKFKNRFIRYSILSSVDFIGYDTYAYCTPTIASAFTRSFEIEHTE